MCGQLVRLGIVPDHPLEGMAQFLEQQTGFRWNLETEVITPKTAYVPSRGQYDSRVLLETLESVARGSGSYLLGFIDGDLFSTVFKHLIGEARFGGPVAVVSIHRLDPMQYGLAEDPDLLRSRTRTEALHETGHMLGLPHCPGLDCSMRSSASPEEIDLKTPWLCPACDALVRGAALSATPTGRSK